MAGAGGITIVGGEAVVIESPSIPIQPRDDKGKYLPKRPLEFTWPHFWLEVAEIAVGILIAQVVIDGSIWIYQILKGWL